VNHSRTHEVNADKDHPTDKVHPADKNILSENLLTTSQAQALESLSAEAPENVKRRAGLLLALSAGQSARAVAAVHGISPSAVYYRRRRFRRKGMDIFSPFAEIQVEASTSETIQLPAATTLPEAAASIHDQPGRFPWPVPQASPGVMKTDLLAEAGRKVMLFHFAEMLRHEPGTRLGEDPEALHDMRVATRRMRAAFEIFGPAFDPKILKPHLKGLRAAGRALGRVRDLDVIIDKGRAYQASLPPNSQEGFTPLLHYWETEREAARETMLAHLNGVQYLAFLEKYNAFVQTPGLGGPGGIVRDVAPILLYTRLEAVRLFDPRLSAASITELHALRIEFKKFRYTVEFFREILGPQAKEVINELKGIQDHLGVLHDADVACLIVRDFLGGWDDLQNAIPLRERIGPESILIYLQDRYAVRTTLMNSFPDAWVRFNREEFRQNFAQSIGEI